MARLIPPGLPCRNYIIELSVGCCPRSPKDARVEVLLSLRMREQQARVTGVIIDFKVFSHYQEKVNVVRLRFGRDITTENEETIEEPCRVRKVIDANEVGGKVLPPRTPTSEARDHFRERHAVNAWR